VPLVKSVRCWPSLVLGLVIVLILGLSRRAIEFSISSRCRSSCSVVYRLSQVTVSRGCLRSKISTSCLVTFPVVMLWRVSSL
jgi:hypothetical protein